MLLLSCSKERQIEKALPGKDWDLEMLEGEGEEVRTKGSGEGAIQTKVSVQASSGKYSFNEEGEGSYEMVVDVSVTVGSNPPVAYTGIATSGTFKWTNDKESVTFDHGSTGSVRYAVDEEDEGWIVQGTDARSLGSFLHDSTGINDQVHDISIDYDLELRQ